MRKVLMLAAVGVLFSGLSFLKADEKGEKVTIKGGAVCAKCALKEPGVTKCQNAVIVTKDGKKTTYFLVNNDFFGASHKALGICMAKKDDPVKVKVTGTVEKKDDKLYLTPTSKIEKEED